MSGNPSVSLIRRLLIGGSLSGAAMVGSASARAQAGEQSLHQRLYDLEAIKQLKARYFMCLDLKDWAGLRALFTDDATFDVKGARNVSEAGSSSPESPIHGADAFVEYARARLSPMVSAHYGHMPVIDLVSDREASAVWAMEDWLYGGNGVLHGQGHYHETYIKADGKWLIDSLRITRLRVTSTL